MSVEKVILDRMKAFIELNSLINGRIYNGVAPDKCAYPLVMFQGIGETRSQTMGGESGLIRARYQFDVYTRDQVERITVSTALKKAFRNWSDETTIPKIEACYIESASDGFEKNEELYRKRIDIEVNYLESL